MWVSIYILVPGPANIGNRPGPNSHIVDFPKARESIYRSEKNTKPGATDLSCSVSYTHLSEPWVFMEPKRQKYCV